ncbi:alpha/beta fold hydrolase [Nocardia niigatensis]|uniref:alpha/beta fold hydrolase n=1 Tax=Nocardia niigatensis TaxID=209249 RepID=UPI0002E93204
MSLRFHVEAIAFPGTGPLVPLPHGFPELWYSWRHRLPALTAAGYRAVAPDLRGHGRTEAPPHTGESSERFAAGRGAAHYPSVRNARCHKRSPAPAIAAFADG